MMNKDRDTLQNQILYVQNLEEKNDEFEIDMSRIASLFWDRRAFAAKCSLGLAVLFLGTSFILPKTYESTAIVQTSMAANTGGASALLASMSGGSGNAVVDSYIALMKSRTVIEPIIANMDYDDEETKKRAIAKYDKWVEKNLRIESTTGTNLISVTASAKTPEKAQEIAQSVIDNFLLLQTDLNQKQQSLLVKFLDERIKEAYKDAAEAGKKFSLYQKEHGIYAPSEQAKIAIGRMDAYANKLVDLKTKQLATNTELSISNEQLSNLNIGSIKYQINDNSTIREMRQNIANKEVELVSLQSRYTDDNPSVKRAELELNKMRESLSQEVNAIVSSQTAAMSPQQSALIGKKLNAEVELKVAEISEQAIKEKQNEEQHKLDDFPEEVRNYMDLQQEAVMKQSIYSKLVDREEEAKMKAAQDSMDIQVVDQPNLPLEEMPASPKKGKNALIGFVIGLLVTLFKVMYVYWRECKADTKSC
ncbi:GumC family protein [Selenomonas ruminantium]|uniref:GumC family protein n=1 Tax=Selenomonas ruminantium TaxID=971 RepID=UPI0004192F24|nr:GumC family protein [Selenomonas ruminantium]